MVSFINDTMQAQGAPEFIARAPETGADRRFNATADLRTFIRLLVESTGTPGSVKPEMTDLAGAIALRVPAQAPTVRKPARTLAPTSAVPDLMAVSCRLVTVDHRNRLRLRSALQGIQLPRHLDVLELGDGFAVLGVAAGGSRSDAGIQLRVDSQQRLLLSPGVTHRLGVGHEARQLLVAGDEDSQQLALVHLGALLAKARNDGAAEAAAR